AGGRARSSQEIRGSHPCAGELIRRPVPIGLAIRKFAMETTAVRFSRPKLPSGPRFPPSGQAGSLGTECRRLPEFLSLLKPRVMTLAVFTALVGLMIAPGHIDPVRAAIAVLAIAAGAGAAGVLNMWYDADIDAVMARTAGRPIPCGAVTRLEALTF